MELSIVSTLYRSAPFVREFHARVKAAAETLTPDYEIILVNDGSPDDSLAIALEVHQADPRTKVVDLSRNFGHHKAMMTGLKHAGGRRVFLIDSDLEEEPELLGVFAREMERSRADVVYGVQETRKGGFFERVSGRLFFALFNVLSAVPIPPNLTTVRLMTRRYVDSLLQHEERETIVAGLWAITGFEQVPMVIAKGSRSGSSYALTRKIVVLVDAVTSFSDRPLVFVFYLGSFIVAISSIAAFYLLVRRLFFGVLLAGWPSVIVSVWLLGGLTLFCLGLIGIYLSRVFIETKKRPYTIIRQVHDHRRAAP
jgi:putative glycosyltransferase